MPKPERIAKINAEIVRQMSKIISNLNNPEISETLISVTRAETSQDLYQTKIYVSVYGDNDKQSRVMKALEESKGFIRRELAHAIDLRITPDIVWVLDDSLDRSERINKILDELKGN